MKRTEIISQYVRVNRQYEVLYAPAVRRALHTKVKAVISDLRSGGYDLAKRNLNQDIGNPRLTNVIRSLYSKVGSRHARITYSRLLQDAGRKSLPSSYIRNDIYWLEKSLHTKGFGFNAEWTTFILDYLKRFLLDKITFRIAETTRDALMRALTVGTVGGLGVDGMIAQLEDWPFERFQAARIVRTEVNRAANVGASAQESTSIYEQQKEWISVKDFRTRGNNPKDHANHVALNGTRIDAGDEFTDPRNGDRLKFPGDPNAKPESSINCRCQAAFVNKRDANGELIPKRKTTSVIYPGQIRRGQTVLI